MKEVIIVATGIANTASVSAAVRRLGANPVLTKDAERVSKANYAILPGVGSFAQGSKGLRAAGLDDALRDRIDADRPTLAVCLGMQLLFEESEEAPGQVGLGILPGGAERYAADVRVPQMGWNTVVPAESCERLVLGDAYFANSYRIVDCPRELDVARSEHGGEFVAAFERGALLACQFHPELSGAYGRTLLERWLANRRSVTC
ncbi:MAG: glutamine amidotransferase [Planctomycetota bacterium]|jgi:glutamine amidotransferase